MERTSKIDISEFLNKQTGDLFSATEFVKLVSAIISEQDRNDEQNSEIDDIDYTLSIINQDIDNIENDITSLDTDKIGYIICKETPIKISVYCFKDKTTADDWNEDPDDPSVLCKFEHTHVQQRPLESPYMFITADGTYQDESVTHYNSSTGLVNLKAKTKPLGTTSLYRIEYNLVSLDVNYGVKTVGTNKVLYKLLDPSQTAVITLGQATRGTDSIETIPMTVNSLVIVPVGDPNPNSPTYKIVANIYDVEDNLLNTKELTFVDHTFIYPSADFQAFNSTSPNYNPAICIFLKENNIGTWSILETPDGAKGIYATNISSYINTLNIAVIMADSKITDNYGWCCESYIDGEFVPTDYDTDIIDLRGLSINILNLGAANNAIDLDREIWINSCWRLEGNFNENSKYDVYSTSMISQISTNAADITFHFDPNVINKFFYQPQGQFGIGIPNYEECVKVKLYDFTEDQDAHSVHVTLDESYTGYGSLKLCSWLLSNCLRDITEIIFDRITGAKIAMFNNPFLDNIPNCVIKVDDTLINFISSGRYITHGLFEPAANKLYYKDSNDEYAKIEGALDFSGYGSPVISTVQNLTGTPITMFKHKVAISGSVNDNCFKNCKQLTTYYCSDLAEIGKSAFEGCTALTTASGIHTVKNRSFYGCELLEGNKTLGYNSIIDESFAYTKISNLTISCSDSTEFVKLGYMPELTSLEITTQFDSVINIPSGALYTGDPDTEDSEIASVLTEIVFDCDIEEFNGEGDIYGLLAPKNKKLKGVEYVTFGEHCNSFQAIVNIKSAEFRIPPQKDVPPTIKASTFDTIVDTNEDKPLKCSNQCSLNITDAESPQFNPNWNDFVNTKQITIEEMN